MGNNFRPNSLAVFSLSKMSEWLSYRSFKFSVFISFYLRFCVPPRKKGVKKWLRQKSRSRKNFSHINPSQTSEWLVNIWEIDSGSRVFQDNKKFRWIVEIVDQKSHDQDTTLSVYQVIITKKSTHFCFLFSKLFSKSKIINTKEKFDLSKIIKAFFIWNTIEFFSPYCCYHLVFLVRHHYHLNLTGSLKYSFPYFQCFLLK